MALCSESGLGALTNLVLLFFLRLKLANIIYALAAEWSESTLFGLVTKDSQQASQNEIQAVEYKTLYY
jgi:hypothetical protein